MIVHNLVVGTTIKCYCKGEHPIVGFANEGKPIVKCSGGHPPGSVFPVLFSGPILTPYGSHAGLIDVVVR